MRRRKAGEQGATPPADDPAYGGAQAPGSTAPRPADLEEEEESTWVPPAEAAPAAAEPSPAAEPADLKVRAAHVAQALAKRTCVNCAQNVYRVLSDDGLNVRTRCRGCQREEVFQVHPPTV